MDLHKPYVLQLIECVKSKSCIWDKKSKDYNHRRPWDSAWAQVVQELRESLGTGEIEVLDVKFTWRSLLNAYKICLSDGNPKNFEFFGQLRFFGDEAAWYNKKEENYFDEVATVPSYIVKTRLVICMLFSLTYLFLLAYQVTQQQLLVPVNFSVIVFCLTIGILVGKIVLGITVHNTWFSPRSIPLKWLSVIIPAISFIIENVIFSPTVVAEESPFFIFLILGFPIFISNAPDIYVESVKKPFPPSQFLAVSQFVCSISWSYLYYVINITMKANWMFYILPASILLNGILSASLSCYFWNNVNRLFPKFMNERFAILAEQPYRVLFY